MFQDIPHGSPTQVRFAGAWYDARILSWSIDKERWLVNVRWWPPRGGSLGGTFPEGDVRGE